MPVAKITVPAEQGGDGALRAQGDSRDGQRQTSRERPFEAEHVPQAGKRGKAREDQQRQRGEESCSGTREIEAGSDLFKHRAHARQRRTKVRCEKKKCEDAVADLEGSWSCINCHSEPAVA
jgi:hypothetical protein